MILFFGGVPIVRADGRVEFRAIKGEPSFLVEHHCRGWDYQGEPVIEEQQFCRRRVVLDVYTDGAPPLSDQAIFQAIYAKLKADGV